MYTLKVKNKYGQMLELTNNAAYVITSIDGLNPPRANINTTINADSDGSVFNSAYLTDRQIIITMAINSPAELNRINLYRYFKNKMPITLYYSNSSRNVYINGYVKDFNVEFFNQKQIAQITIDCLNPYFLEVEQSKNKISGIIDKFEFPFSVEKNENLIPFPYLNSTRTINGINWEVQNDGTIIANGTATAQSNFLIAIFSRQFDYIDYFLSGCPDGGSDYTYYLQVFNETRNEVNNDYGNGKIIEIDADNVSDTYKVIAIIAAGATVNNLIFKPMLNRGDTAKPYEIFNAHDIEFSVLTDEPIEVMNYGDVETGGIITINAEATIANPTVYNRATNEHVTINTTLSVGDSIVINTQNKEKSVTIIKADGTKINAIGLFAAGSSWLKLIPGMNYLQLLSNGAASIAAYVTYDYNAMYEGV